ncbi:MAG TPA: hypothetical protein VKM55_21560 [Candidatus Lokiarchaeia archaeon]|nr:hypothetical protein [Candidatus Lokiarchaeia archaeon]
MADIEVYELHDSGEYSKIEDASLDNIESLLKDDDVLLILCPDVRRLYIFQGAEAPVNKKFISSRVAGQIQRERVKNAGMQHKIVAVAQNDEPDEFIESLGLKNVKTETQRLEEKQRQAEEETQKFEELMQQPDYVPEQKAPSENDTVKASSNLARFMEKAGAAMASFGPVTNIGVGVPAASMSDKEKQEILDAVLKEKLPEDANAEREHLILNESLYVNVKKAAKIFDEDVEVESWDEFNAPLKDGFMFIDNRKIRLLIKDKKIKAVEILKPFESGKKDMPFASDTDNSEEYNADDSSGNTPESED